MEYYKFKDILVTEICWNVAIYFTNTINREDVILNDEMKTKVVEVERPVDQPMKLRLTLVGEVYSIIAI